MFSLTLGRQLLFSDIFPNEMNIYFISTPGYRLKKSFKYVMNIRHTAIPSTYKYGMTVARVHLDCYTVRTF